MKSSSCKKLVSDVYREIATVGEMESTKKSKILQEGFNLTSIMHSSPQEVKLVLVKLVYLLNSGERLAQPQQEKLLCEISKLLIINNHHLKRIIYKILKVIINQQSQYACIQSIVNDLTGSCSIVRQDALKMIPYIKDEQVILQLKKYLFSAINDQNKMISDTAMITSFRLLTLFPNLVIPFSQDILLRLNFQYLKRNIHALTLAYYINKTSVQEFTDILHQFIQQPKCPRMNMQLIRIIEAIISINASDTSVLINYVQSQIQQREQPLVFFQAIKSFTRISSLSTTQLQPFIKKCLEHLEQQEDNIQLFTALKIIAHLVVNKNRIQIIQNDELWHFESLTSSPHAAISRLAFMILFKFWKEDEIAINLKSIYQANQDRRSKIYFMEGLYELISVRLYESEQIITFINAISEDFNEDEILAPALKIFYQVMKYKDHSIEKQIKYFLSLVLNRSSNIIRYAVLLIYEIQNNKIYREVNYQRIYQDYTNLLERYYYNTGKQQKIVC